MSHASAVLPEQFARQWERLHAHLSPQVPRQVLLLPDGWREVLPDGGVLRGAVTEVVAPAAGGRATTFALQVCAAAQRDSGSWEAKIPWCAWLDPSSTLHAPAAAAQGVELERLLVLRPSSSKLASVAWRVIDSGLFAVVIVDTLGVPGARPVLALQRWSSLVRRLSKAAASNGTCVVLLTEEEISSRSSLPVSSRFGLRWEPDGSLAVRVLRDRQGRGFSLRHVDTERLVSQAG